MSWVAVRHEVLTSFFMWSYSAVIVPTLLWWRLLTTVARMTLVSAAYSTILQTIILMLNLRSCQEYTRSDFGLLICILHIVVVVFRHLRS